MLEVFAAHAVSIGPNDPTTVPGGDFHAPGRIRLSYATSLERVKEGLERIGRLLG